MSALDWVVLFGTLGAIVAYGLWKTRGAVGHRPPTCTAATAIAG